ncbi:M48 family metallopeptidase [Aetokthonos hydrillicola Thurmond2011]|jgi:Zn-dependent protease with chaperone function|uniref:M48 family metallopeptidase n=1 Tax=Aetokthonos hydrillicola Thurmond2011 TaxID=2712845 RepID=A0AAP5MDU7_9CYAN|nr:M48 family metallopeptidase [Aetokthonos hydrillicola]MBO3457261.1 M48 family metallopeptidase [Aetokthonos hydrillicola CCALA 1050]MBW4586603.1 M48 family metallopeptidase [Aetokthonos hydrillicola CCALA 1050]MDR9900123.1 M48 family metallopeptidase [Aetokthonos hydrillicola Thurmond2011]
MPNTSANNPTASIDLNFRHYLEVRDRQLSTHLVGGIPDYSFSLDQKLRQKLTAMAPVRAMAQALVSWSVPIVHQLHLMESIAVGPQQYPNIYALGEDCSRRLGIGVPQIFIQSSAESDAYTFATDDITPVIVLSSHIAESFTVEELQFVIGHECGHIHNLHGVYNTICEIMTNQLAEGILEAVPKQGALNLFIKSGLTIFFKRWSRYAEITCDRAGLICCGDVNTAETTFVKLIMGSGKLLEKINIDAYREQISKNPSAPIQLLELFNTHPLIPKRINALRLFAECDIFHSWRPEAQTSNVRTKQETDNLCEQVVRVIPKGY